MSIGFPWQVLMVFRTIPMLEDRLLEDHWCGSFHATWLLKIESIKTLFLFFNSITVSEIQFINVKYYDPLHFWYCIKDILYSIYIIMQIIHYKRGEFILLQQGFWGFKFFIKLLWRFLSQNYFEIFDIYLKMKFWVFHSQFLITTCEVWPFSSIWIFLFP